MRKVKTKRPHSNSLQPTARLRFAAAEFGRWPLDGHRNSEANQTTRVTRVILGDCDRSPYEWLTTETQTYKEVTAHARICESHTRR